MRVIAADAVVIDEPCAAVWRDDVAREFWDDRRMSSPEGAHGEEPEGREDGAPSSEEIARRKAWFYSYIERLENSSVVLGPENGPYRCPCCHHLTLDERGGYDICPVCFWEDDGQDDQDADAIRGGPNPGSLTQARMNYLRFGASDQRRLEHVRPPLPSEE